MLYNFCVSCNTTSDFLEVHHIIPVCLAGTDEEWNLISVCSACHAKIHEFGFRRGSMLELQAVGIAKAKAAGKYTGRAPTARRKSEQVLQLSREGKTNQQIALECNISIASVYRIKREVIP